jgi:CRP-like cAMP-binding protein
VVATPTRPGVLSQQTMPQMLQSGVSKKNQVHLTAGSSIPLLRNSLWIVANGMVKLGAVTEQGDELLLGLVGPNEPFGEPLSMVEAYEAITLTDCDLICLTLEEISQSSDLSMLMVNAVAARVRQTEFMLSLLGLRRVEDRVRAFLELMAQDYGQPCDQGLRVGLRLTHQEIASALSTTRVTVTRVVGQLRDQGWLTLDAQRHLVITHLPQR